MPEIAASDSRRLTAERNLEAILDGAERLLRRGLEPSMSAVASEAGVSRPTVYAHFPDRQALLQALVKRTVGEAMTAIRSAEVERGPAPQALQRLIAAGWQQIANHDEIAHAALGALSADAMRDAHMSVREAILELIERGRREGAFRADVPAGWLVTAGLALVHATAEEVRAGQLDARDAPALLLRMIADLVGRRRGSRGNARDASSF
jgi:AcrR family transcriptional regulator